MKTNPVEIAAKFVLPYTSGGALLAQADNSNHDDVAMWYSYRVSKICDDGPA
jgi:hypothetical protein